MYGGNYFASIYFSDYFGGFNISSPDKYVVDGGVGIDEITLTNLTPPVINQKPEAKYIRSIRFY